MHQNSKKLKEEIKRISMELTKFYNEASETQQDAYLTGKKEAFEDILNWLANNHNSEFRHINTSSFFSMIQDKINKSKTSLLNNGADYIEEDKPNKTINLSHIRVQESRKRVNKYASDYYNGNMDYNNDCIMDQEDRVFQSPFKLNNQSNVENNNIFQNTNVAFGNGFGNESTTNNEIISNNIFFPIKKEKK